MENQHRAIKGYRELNETEIALMNKIKEKGQELAALISDVTVALETQRMNPKDGADAQRMVLAEPMRWVKISQTHFQEGLMALTRSVAQPTFF